VTKVQRHQFFCTVAVESDSCITIAWNLKCTFLKNVLVTNQDSSTLSRHMYHVSNVLGDSKMIVDKYGNYVTKIYVATVWVG
jgi:hypothetical protein